MMTLKVGTHTDVCLSLEDSATLHHNDDGTAIVVVTGRSTCVLAYPRPQSVAVLVFEPSRSFRQVV